MTIQAQIVTILLLIIIGLNLAANNAFISIMINYVFYKDPVAIRLIRVFGLTMALSSILVIINETTYAIYINVLIFLILTFFSIRGRNIAMREKMAKRDKLMQDYAKEIKEKRQRLEALKNKTATEASKADLETKSVQDLKKKMWDDGKMTNKDIINGLKK